LRIWLEQKARNVIVEFIMQQPVPRQTFVTRQFMAGNSPAVRIPANMAFPHKTELAVIRDGDRIIVAPKEKAIEEIQQFPGNRQILSFAT
jgi:virulence-associated protein VagC